METIGVVALVLLIPVSMALTWIKATGRAG
jgi:hypothetical protein